MSLVLEHFKSFLHNYTSVDDLIREFALIEFAGKNIMNVTGKVQPIFPDGGFQIDLSTISNISKARYKDISITLVNYVKNA